MNYVIFMIVSKENDKMINEGEGNDWFVEKAKGFAKVFYKKYSPRDIDEIELFVNGVSDLIKNVGGYRPDSADVYDAIGEIAYMYGLEDEFDNY